MEPVALAALLTELFLSIHNIGGYPVPEAHPVGHQISRAELEQRFCSNPCGVKAFYARSEGVFIDAELDLERDVHARSILLHELVPCGPLRPPEMVRLSGPQGTNKQK